MADMVCDRTGKTLVDGVSDAAACRFWLERGHQDDYLASTGERLESVVPGIFPDATWRIDCEGYVMGGDAGDEE